MGVFWDAGAVTVSVNGQQVRHTDTPLFRNDLLEKRESSLLTTQWYEFTLSS
jgi:hypothetical protein